MEHYVCSGTCGAVSDEQKLCQDLSCPSYNQPFQSCECEDDRHGRESNAEEYQKLDDQWEV